jgi:hypothetical protein
MFMMGQMKKKIFFLIAFVQFVCCHVHAQVVIEADPSDAPSESATNKNSTVSSQVDDVKTTKKISYNKEDREKALALLKKFFPDKSFSALNHLMSRYLEDGALVLTPEENKELSDVVAKEPDQSLVDKIQDFALGGSDTKGLFAGIEELRKAFAENPLSLVPKDQVKETLLKQWEGKFLGNVFRNNPKVLDFFATLVIDKNAVPKLLDIFQKKNELKYFTVLVVIAQLMCLLAFFTLFKQSGLLGRFFKRTILMLSVNALLILYFIWRFYPEVSPTLSIFHQAFFA